MRLDAADAGQLLQRDTYFDVPHGRLKLRESEQGAELIFYDREETAPERWSDYQISPIADPVGLHGVLGSALGERGVVTKRRQVYLWQGSRIHVDEVEELGTFVEFEVVSAGDASDDRRRLDTLKLAFGLTDEAAIRSSYADLLGL